MYTCMRNFPGVTLKRRTESPFWSYEQFPLRDWPQLLRLEMEQQESLRLQAEPGTLQYFATGVGL